MQSFCWMWACVSMGQPLFWIHLVLSCASSNKCSAPSAFKLRVAVPVYSWGLRVVLTMKYLRVVFTIKCLCVALPIKCLRVVLSI